MEVDEYSYPRDHTAPALPTFDSLVSDIRRIKVGKSENICGIIVSRKKFDPMMGWREWHVAGTYPRAVETAADAASEVANQLLANIDNDHRRSVA